MILNAPLQANLSFGVKLFFLIFGCFSSCFYEFSFFFFSTFLVVVAYPVFCFSLYVSGLAVAIAKARVG